VRFDVFNLALDCYLILTEKSYSSDLVNQGGLTLSAWFVRLTGKVASSTWQRPELVSF
jgi:hypothetical protein